MEKIRNTQRMGIKLFIAFLFSLTIISAVTVYSGDPVVIQLEKQFDYYSVVGNSTSVELEITQDGNNVTIIPDKHMTTDSFEIIFFDRDKETITVYESSGGGGSSTRWRTEYKDRNITKYIDKEVIKEVPGETISTMEEGPSSSFWAWVWGMCLIGVMGFLLIKILFFGECPQEDYINRAEKEVKKYE